MATKGVTQQALGDSIGKTRQAIGYYVDGSSSPDWETLATIAATLDVSADYLLGLSDAKSLDIEVRQVCDFTELSEAAVLGLDDLNWWYEVLDETGSVKINKDGIPWQVPHDGIMPSGILSRMLEDEEFRRCLGVISKCTASSVRKGFRAYDNSEPPCADESDGVRVNPFMRPFNDTSWDMEIGSLSRHFGNVVERIFQNYEKENPL